MAHSPEWEADCLKERGRVLKGKFAHWCFDWDDMTVDETTDEWSCCHCFTKEERDRGYPDDVQAEI